MLVLRKVRTNRKVFFFVLTSWDGWLFSGPSLGVVAMGVSDFPNADSNARHFWQLRRCIRILAPLKKNSQGWVKNIITNICLIWGTAHSKKLIWQFKIPPILNYMCSKGPCYICQCVYKRAPSTGIHREKELFIFQPPCWRQMHIHSTW